MFVAALAVLLGCHAQLCPRSENHRATSAWVTFAWLGERGEEAVQTGIQGLGLVEFRTWFGWCSLSQGIGTGRDGRVVFDALVTSSVTAFT